MHHIIHLLMVYRIPGSILSIYRVLKFINYRDSQGTQNNI